MGVHMFVEGGGASSLLGVEDVGGCFFSWVFLCLFGLCLLMGGVTAYDD